MSDVLYLRKTGAVFLTVFLYLLGLSDFVHAEATCSTVVSFTVEREGQGQTATEVFFGELKARGPEEEGVKTKISTDIEKAKSRALDRCKNQYENTSGCLQGKLAASSNVYQSASFTARKALEEALLSDCKKQQGICKTVKAAEIKCVLIEPTPTPDPKVAGSKPESKKEEKPKK